jgi:hypothetical protein
MELRWSLRGISAKRWTLTPIKAVHMEKATRLGPDRISG